MRLAAAARRLQERRKRGLVASCTGSARAAAGWCRWAWHRRARSDRRGAPRWCARGRRSGAFAVGAGDRARRARRRAVAAPRAATALRPGGWSGAPTAPRPRSTMRRDCGPRHALSSASAEASGSRRGHPASRPSRGRSTAATGRVDSSPHRRIAAPNWTGWLEVSLPTRAPRSWYEASGRGLSGVWLGGELGAGSGSMSLDWPVGIGTLPWTIRRTRPCPRVRVGTVRRRTTTS